MQIQLATFVVSATNINYHSWIYSQSNRKRLRRTFSSEFEMLKIQFSIFKKINDFEESKSWAFKNSKCKRILLKHFQAFSKTFRSSSHPNPLRVVMCVPLDYIMSSSSITNSFNGTEITRPPEKTQQMKCCHFLYIFLFFRPVDLPKIDRSLKHCWSSNTKGLFHIPFLQVEWET